MLQDENSKLAEGVRLKRDQISSAVLKQIAEKDALIAELTQKLKASTSTIKEIKSSRQVSAFAQQTNQEEMDRKMTQL